MLESLYEIIEKNILSAFCGALASYLVIRSAEAIKELTELRKKERSNLTRLERHLLILIPKWNGNIQVLKTYKSTLIALQKQKFFDHVPDLFEIVPEPQLTENIRDLDIINNYLQLILHMEFNMKGLSGLNMEMNKIRKELAENMVSGGIPMEIAQKLERSMPQLLNAADHLDELIHETFKQAQALQAEIRIESRKFSMFNDLFYRPIRSGSKKREKRMQKELGKLKDESDEIVAKRKTKEIEGDQVFAAVGLTEDEIAPNTAVPR